MKTMLIAAILLLAVSCKNDKDKAAHTTSVSTDSMIVKKDSPQQNTDDPIAEIKKEYGMLQAQLEEKN
jgi:hypothetical protein